MGWKSERERAQKLLPGGAMYEGCSVTACGNSALATSTTWRSGVREVSGEDLETVAVGPSTQVHGMWVGMPDYKVNLPGLMEEG